MCGIVGYVGPKDCSEVLVNALTKLEYRGYDSAGIAVFDNGEIKDEKSKGRLKDLENKMEKEGTPNGFAGIGHTRWATHGEPSDVNSHPHSGERVTIVHNGIIENYKPLKEFLLSQGRVFQSETDTEVVAQLLDYYYDGNPLETIKKVMHELEGSFALGIVFADFKDTVYAVRCESPLIVGVGENESFIASDVPAILKYTRNVYYIGNLEMAKVSKEEITFYNLDGEEIQKKMITVDWDAEAAEKAGYEHFMMKEIHEQPRAVKDTLNSVLKDGKIDLTDIGLAEEDIRRTSQIYIVACGSAYHVGMVAQYVIEDLVKIPVRVELASEFRYRKPILDPNGLVIIISQSGETADSLAALRETKAQGIRTLGIVNVVGSSIAREADKVFYTLAGPEISVATTKAYSTQLMASYILAIQFAKVKNTITEEQYEYYIAELQAFPEKIEMIIED